MLEEEKVSNQIKAYRQKYNYSLWKKDSLDSKGFFVIFNGFLENGHLRRISGGALKLYVFLGIKSDNFTGESYYSLESIANYFEVSTRTISNWFLELEQRKLIVRYQLEFNGVSHTYLNTYEGGSDRINKAADYFNDNDNK